MLEFNPICLFMVLGSLMILGAVIQHCHNCSLVVQKKRHEVKSLSRQLEKKIRELEEEVVDLQVEIDEVNDQIKTLRV